MAKSSTYFGLRRGSTKSLTFSVADGKQITKDRVVGGKDPRTLAQMTQRCMVATVGAAYSAMKSICDHSFEGVTAGMQCMREFTSCNLSQLQICKEYDNGFFGFNKYKEVGLHAGSYIISKGTLPQPLVDATIDSVNVNDKKVTLTLVLTANGTIAEVAEDMGCKSFGDSCSVAVMYPKADGTYGFGVVSFTYQSGTTVLESFVLAVTGDITSATPSFVSNTLKLEVRTAYRLASEATVSNTYLTAITSRKVNGIWKRSPAQFDVTDATPSFTQAIETYPIGKERFLNGSATVASTSNASGTGGNTQQGGSTGGNTSNTGSNTGDGSITGGGTNTGGGSTGGDTGDNTGGDDYHDPDGGTNSDE